MPYASDAHRKYSLKYHIIFVCKYRKNLLEREDIGKFMKEGMIRIANGSKFIIDTIEIDRNHMHLLISSTPSISAAQIVRKLKQESTIAAWKHFSEFLKKHFWKERTFWTDGYFVSSTGQASEETIGDTLKTKVKRAIHPLD